VSGPTAWVVCGRTVRPETPLWRRHESTTSSLCHECDGHGRVLSRKSQSQPEVRSYDRPPVIRPAMMWSSVVGQLFQQIFPLPPSLRWSARTGGASHESPPVVSVQGRQHCFVNVLTAPRQNVVDPSPYRSSWLSFTFHHPQHQWLYQPVVWHSADMAEQLKLSLSNGVHHCPLPLQLSSDFIVGNVVLPVDFQYVSVSPRLRCLQSTLIIFLRGPRFCCI